MSSDSATRPRSGPSPTPGSDSLPSWPSHRWCDGSSLPHFVGGTPSTNAIEAASYQLRKVTRNRGHFPSDEAAVKLLWLAICNIEDKRARQRQKEQQKGRAGKSATTGRLIEGAITTNWKQALQQLSLAYPDRINPHL